MISLCLFGQVSLFDFEASSVFDFDEFYIFFKSFGNTFMFLQMNRFCVEDG